MINLISQVARKKHLTGEDCGRVFLTATAQSAILSEAVTLPENISNFICNQLPLLKNEFQAYQLFLQLASWLSLQRALADAHVLRLYSFITSVSISVETSCVLESALDYFDDPARAELAYAQRAGFCGFGTEAYIPSLCAEAAQQINKLNRDSALTLSSLKFISAFNQAVELLAEATRTDLSPLSLNLTPIKESILILKANFAKLAALQKNGTPMADEKLAATAFLQEKIAFLEQFPAPSEDTVARAKEVIRAFMNFESVDMPLVEILMEEEA